MKHTRLRLLLAFIVALLLFATAAQAQTGGAYDLSWNTVDDGGSLSVGGGYQLVDTIGQPDAGIMQGGGYELRGGFWAGVASEYRDYLPLVLKRA